MQTLIRGLMAVVIGVLLIGVNAVGTATQQPADPPEKTPEEWLKQCDANGNGRVTCAEARAESCGAPIPVTRDHPLYQFMRDGDSDGQVCE